MYVPDRLLCAVLCNPRFRDSSRAYPRECLKSRNTLRGGKRWNGRKENVARRESGKEKVVGRVKRDGYLRSIERFPFNALLRPGYMVRISVPRVHFQFTEQPDNVRGRGKRKQRTEKRALETGPAVAIGRLRST